MPIVLVKNVLCYACYKPTPLLASSLEEKLGYPLGSSTYEIQVFFGCPDCTTVAQSEIPTQTERLEIAEGRQHPGGKVPFRVLLECDRTDCEARIDILGVGKIGMNNPRAKDVCRSWKFGREVQCEHMDHPMRPAEIFRLTLGE